MKTKKMNTVEWKKIDIKNVHSDFEKFAKKPIIEAFKEVVEKLKKHRAYDHPLFKYMAKEAQEGTLTAEQFEFFRHTMFSRIHLTVYCISEMMKSSILNGERELFATALKNAKEEGGEGEVEKMHPVLAEKAFNTLGQKIFGLKPTTLVEEYKDIRTPQECIYHYVIKQLYEEHPLVISLAQELSSAGNKKSLGMMGGMYQSFQPYEGKIGGKEFQRSILPYYDEHINIKEHIEYEPSSKKIKSYRTEILPVTNSVEDVHRQRAEEDLIKSFNSEEDVYKAEKQMLAYANVQAELLDTALIEIMQRSKTKTLGNRKLSSELSSDKSSDSEETISEAIEIIGGSTTHSPVKKTEETQRPNLTFVDKLNRKPVFTCTAKTKEEKLKQWSKSSANLTNFY